LRIEKSCGKPAVPTSSAFVDGLRALGVNSVAVGSPYVDLVNERLRTFLETNGFIVPSFEALHTKTAFENGNHQPGTIKKLAHDADSASADAVFLPCTNFPSASVIEELEQELGKPVVSANQATLWQILRAAGIDAPIDGYGELLRLR
jgi:arylmalonate decarboxylase